MAVSLSGVVYFDIVKHSFTLRVSLLVEQYPGDNWGFS